MFCITGSLIRRWYSVKVTDDSDICKNFEKLCLVSWKIFFFKISDLDHVCKTLRVPLSRFKKFYENKYLLTLLYAINGWSRLWFSRLLTRPRTFRPLQTVKVREQRMKSRILKKKKKNRCGRLLGILLPSFLLFRQQFSHCPHWFTPLQFIASIIFWETRPFFQIGLPSTRVVHLER